MKLKYFLAFVFTFSVFANELEAAKNELFSELKKFGIKESEIDYSDRPLHYIQYLNVQDGQSRESNTIENYKLPRFKFYEKSDLSGKPFAEIKDDGFYLDNERLCTMGSREGEANKTEFLVSYDSQCTWDPILKLGNKNDLVIGMKLVDYNEKTDIGKVKIARRIGYVDLKEVKDKYRIIPTMKLIEKHYTKEEIKGISDALKKFRIDTKDFTRKQLIDYVFNNSNKKVSISRHSNNIYRDLEKDKPIPRSHRIQLLYSTFISHVIYNDSTENFVKMANSKPKNICLNSSYEYYFCLTRKKDNMWYVDWLITKE